MSKRPVFNAETGTNPLASRFESIVIIPNCMMDPILDDQPNDARLASIREDHAISAANYACPESKLPEVQSIARAPYEDFIDIKNTALPQAKSSSSIPASFVIGDDNSPLTGSSISTSVNGDAIFEADSEFDMASIAHSQLPETKLNAFAAIRDRSVCVSGTKEFRLAKSVCYDFGKILAELCPPHLTDKESKFFIKTNFDRWISQYDNLGPFFDVLVPCTRKETGPKLRLVVHLRMAAQEGRYRRNK